MRKTRAATLGALCTAVSAALARAPATQLKVKPRFADAATWAVAAAPSLGIAEAKMQAVLTPDPLARQIAALVHEKETWEGAATDLLKVLGLPTSPTQLARRLRNCPLGLFGVAVGYTRQPGGHPPDAHHRK